MIIRNVQDTERPVAHDEDVTVVDGGFKSYQSLKAFTAAAIVALTAICVAEANEQNTVTDITALTGKALAWAGMMTAAAWSCFYGQRSDCRQAAVELAQSDPAAFWRTIEAYRTKASSEDVAAMEAWLQAEGLSDGR